MINHRCDAYLYDPYTHIIDAYTQCGQVCVVSVIPCVAYARQCVPACSNALLIVRVGLGADARVGVAMGWE